MVGITKRLDAIQTTNTFIVPIKFLFVISKICWATQASFVKKKFVWDSEKFCCLDDNQAFFSKLQIRAARQNF